MLADLVLAPWRWIRGYIARSRAEYAAKLASPVCPECGERKPIGVPNCSDCWGDNASVP